MQFEMQTFTCDEHGEHPTIPSRPEACAECFREGQRKRNPRLNAISSIAYAWAGGSVKFYRLPKDTRLAYRARAARLVDTTSQDCDIEPKAPRRRRRTVHPAIRATRASNREKYRTLDREVVEEKPRFVYVASNGETTKVGISSDPFARTRSANTWCRPKRRWEIVWHEMFETPAVAEALVHLRLTGCRVPKTQELFACDPDLAIEVCRDVQAALNKEDA